MKTAIATLMVLCFGLLPSAKAQDKNLSVEDAIHIALKNNTEVRAKSLEVLAMQSKKRTAGELPKLDLNAQLGQYNSTNFDNAFELSQSIPFPTLFGAKRALVNAEVKSKEWQQQITENELKNQVRSYYYQLVYLQYNKTKLQYLDTLYIDFVKAAALRFKTGESKKLELSTAETKRGEISLLLQQNETYISNAYQNLKTLMNTKTDFSIANPPRYEPLMVSALLDSTAIANHPIVRSLYQNALIAEQNIKVEKALALPDFKVGYNNQSLIGFQNINGEERYFGAGKRFSAVSFGIAIPLTFGANKARVQSLNYQTQAAEATAQYQQQQLETQLKNALQQYHQYREQYNYYLQKALPNAAEIVQGAKLGYRTGDINYVEYLYALQTATDIELKYLEAIQQVNQAVVSINYLMNK
ncbi:TolC family protein [Pedobacter sp. UC225_65]|uniref:TolC family protein n=1 Tax=Pedobacter sp. UC225_65 TaxID=3350173 RepID=UPI00366EC22E